MVRPILPKQEERESPSLDCSDPPRTTKRRCISSACIPCRRRKSKVRGPLPSGSGADPRKCDGVMPACSTCKAVYRMECVYDVDGDRRRKGATEKERKNDSLDNLVSRLRSAPENEVDTIVDQLCTTAASTLGNCLGTRPEKRKSSDEPYLQAEERTFVQDMGKLQIDEQGDMRHFGHSSSLESIHTWPRRICLPPEPVTTGPLWTNVTSDNELISQLLVSVSHRWSETFSLANQPITFTGSLFHLASPRARLVLQVVLPIRHE